jgi:ribosome-associated protein
MPKARAGFYMSDLYLVKESELSFEFIRSAGPGGQNVNKVATAVRLRFDIRRSTSLPTEVKEKLLRLAGKKVDKNGILLIRGQRFRTQEANRRDTVKRLEKLLQEATKIPRKRKSTKPSLSSKWVRLERKHLRGEIKVSRRKIRQILE